MRRVPMLLWLCVGSITAWPVAAQMDPAPVHPELRPLFDRLGGEAGVAALVDDFLRIVRDDARIAPFFENSDLAVVKQHLVEQFCAIMGGGCHYSGFDMLAVHEPLGIRQAEFNALVEDLQQAMDRHGVPYRMQNRFLAVLAPMRREIVTE